MALALPPDDNDGLTRPPQNLKITTREIKCEGGGPYPPCLTGVISSRDELRGANVLVNYETSI